MKRWSARTKRRAGKRLAAGRLLSVFLIVLISLMLLPASAFGPALADDSTAPAPETQVSEPSTTGGEVVATGEEVAEEPPEGEVSEDEPAEKAEDSSETTSAEAESSTPPGSTTPDEATSPPTQVRGQLASPLGANVSCGGPKPSIELSKDGPDSACPGDCVTYEFEVENDGDCKLYNITVSDPRLGGTIKTISCLDKNRDVDFDVSYTIPEGATGTLSNTATAVGYTYGGTAVSDTESHDISIKSASVKLEKSGPAEAEVHDNIVYNFKITNTGNTTLTDVKVKDPLLGNADSGYVIKTYSSINPNSSKAFNVTYPTDLSTPECLVNTAEVTAKSCCGSVSDQASWTVHVKHPGISINKCGPACATPGQKVTYTFTVTNTGQLKLTNPTVEDPTIGMTYHIPGNLKVGDPPYVFTREYTIPSDFAGSSFTNKATVTANFRSCKNISATDSHTIKTGHPGISLTKNARVDCARVGDTITYDFTLQNTGIFDLTNVVVSDDTLDDPNPIWTGSLPAGSGLVTFAGTYTVKSGDSSPLVNLAKVTADAPCPGEVTASASDEVKIIRPAISLSKSADVSSARVGDKITYTFTVENTGDSNLKGVIVDDPLLGGTVYGPVDLAAKSGPQTFTREYTVPESAPCLLKNTASATGTPCCGADVTASASYEVRIIRPAISLSKDANDTIYRVGDTIAYTFIVENTGSSELTGVIVDDPLLGGTVYGPVDLAAKSGPQTFTATYTVKDTDPSPLLNTATATGTPACGPDVSATASDEVKIIHPAMTIEKTGPDSAEVGDTVTYEFSVTNTGDCELTNVNVTDDVLGDIGTLASLAVGETYTFTKDYTIEADDPDPLVNTATATGAPGIGEVISAEAQHTLDIAVTPLLPVGAIKITKVLDDADGTVQEGDDVVFTVTVENTGQALIPAPVTVEDTYDPGYLSFISASINPDSDTGGTLKWSDVSGDKGLKSGDSVSITLNFKALKAGGTINDAAVSAVDANGAELTGSASAPVRITEAPQPLIPVKPEQPITPVLQVVTAVLPVTGGDLTGIMLASLLLLPLGLALLTVGFARRRLQLRLARNDIA